MRSGTAIGPERKLLFLLNDGKTRAGFMPVSYNRCTQTWSTFRSGRGLLNRNRYLSHMKFFFLSDWPPANGPN